MAKQLVGVAKFQIPGGQATPAPPVGTSLGKYGINLGQFVQAFNDRTKEAAGLMIPVVVSVYNEHDEGRHRHPRSVGRDRHAEDERPQRPGRRSRGSHDRRNRSQHGPRRRRLARVVLP